MIGKNEYIKMLEKEIKQLKEELQQEKKDFKETNDYCFELCFELKDYKSRNEKAREMIRFIAYNSERPLTMTELNKVYNILGGDANET